MTQSVVSKKSEFKPQLGGVFSSESMSQIDVAPRRQKVRSSRK
jgi:hypothetical protein